MFPSCQSCKLTVATRDKLFMSSQQITDCPYPPWATQGPLTSTTPTGRHITSCIEKLPGWCSGWFWGNKERLSAHDSLQSSLLFSGLTEQNGVHHHQRLGQALERGDFMSLWVTIGRLQSTGSDLSLVFAKQMYPAQIQQPSQNESMFPMLLVCFASSYSFLPAQPPVSTPSLYPKART